MLDIYSYLDPAKFLADKLEEKKLNNSSFSLRAWAKQLGMKSHGPLHAILKGQRSIPKNLVPLFIKAIKLNKSEGKYFEALVDYQRAKNITEKDFYHERLKALAPRPLREINDIENYKYVTDPMHFIILEMSELAKFKADPIWIQKHLRLNISLRDIEEILQRLYNLELLKKENGKTKKQVKHIYTTQEVKDKAVQIFHKRCSENAISQIEAQEIEDREFNAITFNIKKQDLKKIKETIREFVNNIVSEYESPPETGEETYHLNVQFFSVSK
jgi:uncharacterized protein (TIGR02147 family)